MNSKNFKKLFAMLSCMSFAFSSLLVFAQGEKAYTIQEGGSILGWLYDIFGKILNFLYTYTGKNYIIAILLFALLVKIACFPLSIKQQKMSQKMASLRPKEMAIRNKYAGRTDKATQQKMQQEIMTLYQQENYNPAGGCLPLFIQMPIIFALYRVIMSPLSYVFNYSENFAKIAEVLGKHAERLGIKSTVILQNDAVFHIATDSAVQADLGTEISGKIINFYNEFSIFGNKSLNLMNKPSFDSNQLFMLIIPLLVFVASFASTKIIRKFTYQPAAAAEQQASMKLMDWTMPLMSTWFCFMVPSLIGIYWIFQNVLSILQQYLLYKLFPVKEPTEDEIREAMLLMKGKSPQNAQKQIQKSSKQPQKKSSAAIRKKKNGFTLIYRKKGLNPEYVKKLKEKNAKPKALRSVGGKK